MACGDSLLDTNTSDVAQLAVREYHNTSQRLVFTSSGIIVPKNSEQWIPCVVPTGLRSIGTTEIIEKHDC